MRQHLDITDVEARTKIRAKYLRALENEDFGMLPGSTFVKSFLRTYAEFLGLDPHLLVEEYRVRHDPRDESELTPFAPRPKGRERRRPPRNRAPWLGGVLAVVGILALLLILGLTGGSGDDSSTDTATTATTHAKKAKKKPAVAHRRKHRPRPRTVKLRIVPVRPAYVCVDKGLGTKSVFESNPMTKSRTFKAKHLRVSVGQRSVKLISNGRAVRVPSGSQPIAYDFRPKGYRMIPSSTRWPCNP